MPSCAIIRKCNDLQAHCPGEQVVLRLRFGCVLQGSEVYVSSPPGIEVGKYQKPAWAGILGYSTFVAVGSRPAVFYETGVPYNPRPIVIG